MAKLRHLKVDHALVTTFVERWRLQTRTFHFPTRECIISLEDVTLQTDLRIDRLPVIAPTKFDWEDICDTYLGIVPVKGESLVGSMVKLKWLSDQSRIWSNKNK
uniref:Serine/threonine protein phosphatase 7 long form isogeny n=1 Tax=Cajanus cajan TaxID=3821 RepID=A0A151QXI9_CAJCA|nr:Serine/threonine protein phosphatase 7 long form isogeny [Cajanus cajan]